MTLDELLYEHNPVKEITPALQEVWQARADVDENVWLVWLGRSCRNGRLFWDKKHRLFKAAVNIKWQLFDKVLTRPRLPGDELLLDDLVSTCIGYRIETDELRGWLDQQLNAGKIMQIGDGEETDYVKCG